MLLLSESGRGIDIQIPTTHHSYSSGMRDLKLSAVSQGGSLHALDILADPVTQ